MKYLLFAALVCTSFASAETLRVLNWSDYIDETFLEKFSQQFDVEFDYVTYEDIDQFDFQFFSIIMALRCNRKNLKTKFLLIFLDF